MSIAENATIKASRFKLWVKLSYNTALTASEQKSEKK